MWENIKDEQKKLNWLMYFSTYKQKYYASGCNILHSHSPTFRSLKPLFVFITLS